MPKIQYIAGEKSGEVRDVSEAWLSNFARRLGVEFELVPEIAKGSQVAESGESKERAFLNLGEADRQSVRDGFKELVLRKAGWILRDCTNKAISEIHISLPDSARIADARNGAIAKAKRDVEVLRAFKDGLHRLVDNEDFIFSFEECDRDGVHSLVDSLSIGYSEVEALKVEVTDLKRRLGVK